MQGIGVLIFVVGYAAAFTAYQQGFGPGGSFLYWLTGNPRMGQPTQSQPGGGGGKPNPSVSGFNKNQPSDTHGGGFHGVTRGL